MPEQRRTDAKTVLAQLVDEFAPLLTADAGAFLRRVYGSGIDVYEDRLGAYGFRGLTRVLDAGCGFGQWTLALSRMCSEVCAVDVVADRLVFVRELARRLAVENVRVSRASLVQTGFPDASFDAVFCYGVIFLTPWRDSLRELVRILRPGGRLYVNANGFGWYKHLWYTAHNATPDYDPQMRVSATLRNTLHYRNGLPLETGMDILIEPKEMLGALTELGLVNVFCGAEGTLRAPDGAVQEPRPFFAGEYGGETGVYEVLAWKCD